MTTRGYGGDRRRAWRAFLQAHATLLDVLEQELEQAQGLPLTWYDVLSQLSEAPDGRLRMQQLAERLVLSRSGLTRRIDAMERHGLVERFPCADDRRGMWAVLTDEGRRRYAAAYRCHVEGIVAHFTSKLDADEAAALADVLERVASSAQEGRLG